jgi:hypothetical protein
VSDSPTGQPAPAQVQVQVPIPLDGVAAGAEAPPSEHSAVFTASTPEEREQLLDTMAPHVAPGTDARGLVDELAAHEDEILRWIGESPSNAQQFLEDPISALKSAGLGVSKGTLKAVKATSQSLAGAAASATPPNAAPPGAAATTAAPVRTRGWDLIAATTQGTLNELIAVAFSRGEFPSTLEFEVGGNKVKLVLGAPSLDLSPTRAAGRTGFAAMVIPIASGTIAEGPGETPVPPGGSIEILAPLAFVKAGESERLSLDLQSESAEYGLKAPGLAPPVVKLAEDAIAAHFKGLEPGALHFGGVSLPSAAPFSPVGPSSFAIQTQTDPNLNALLLLMTTPSGTPSGDTGFNADAPLVPGGQKAALYVSNRLLMEGLVAPAIAGKVGISPESFNVSGGAGSATSISFSGAKSLDGEYEPELTGFTLSVNEIDQIQGAYTVRAHPGFNAGSVYYVEVTGNIFVTPKLDAATGEVKFESSHDEAEGAIRCSPVGWILLSAAIVFSFGSVVLFVAGVVGIVIAVIIASLSFPIALPESVLAPMGEALKSFNWPAQEGFQITNVELPGDLLVTGNPTA